MQASTGSRSRGPKWIGWAWCSPHLVRKRRAERFQVVEVGRGRGGVDARPLERAVLVGDKAAEPGSGRQAKRERTRKHAVIGQAQEDLPVPLGNVPALVGQPVRGE